MKWDAKLYDDKHAFVFQYGESVLELLSAQPDERVLDLGCGTGHLANEIEKTGAEVIGIDASSEMIAQARKAYPDIDFFIKDATDFDFNEPFDAIFSNATLHWIHDADAAIKCIYDSLKPGGRFVAEMGGKGNMQHMIAVVQDVLDMHGYRHIPKAKLWYFPSIGEYATKLEKAGFRVTFAIHFDRKTLLQDGRAGVAKWLDMFVPAFFEGIEQVKKQQILSEITDRLEPYYNEEGNWYADYKRLRFVAVKEM